MKKIAIVLSALLVLVGLVGISIAAGPAPYTGPALEKLSKSTDKLGAFVPPVGATKEEIIKHLIQYYSKIYTQAGFSFEKSVIQYSNDLNKDADFMSNGIYRNTPALISEMFSNQLNEIRKENKLKSTVDKSLSKDTVRALDNIMAIDQKKEAEIYAENERKIQIAKAARENEIMENEAKRLKEIEEEKIAEKVAFEMQKKDLESKERIKAAEAEKRKEQAELQAKLESIEKQNALKRLIGHYENQEGRKQKRQVIGVLNVAVKKDKAINFTLYNKMGYATCKMENQEAKLEYVTSGGFKAVYSSTSETKRRETSNNNNENCSIEIVFKEASEAVKESKGYDSYVEIDSNGCRQFCERGGTFMGRYWKTSDEPKL